MLYPVIAPLIIWLLYGKEVLMKAASGVSGKVEKLLGYAVSVLFYVFVAYSVFLPLRFDSTWFPVGLLIYLIGVVFDVTAGRSFASTPLNQPVTTGIYRISRNPFYFSQFLVLMGVSIACLSWIFLLGATIYLIILNVSVPAEERFCLEKYGDTYREYMDRTPRWIGMPKPKKEQ